MSDVPAPAPGEPDLTLPEFDLPPLDPGPLLLEWFERAERLGIPEYLAAALATTDASGSPSNRMVLLKRVDAGGVTFTTTSTSRKGRELAARPRGAMSIYWRETQQQLRLEGAVRRLSVEESDALFAVRPIASQASAIASRQSEPLDDPTDLVVRAAELAASATPLPRPEGWFGYRLEPDVIEFWHGTAHRLHRRLRYARSDDGWSHERLQP
ncbi:pyridoxamine 5'-phosphate oxidase [Salinibacterium sp. SYSU T00001]|uniref:pyridoxamine 5'-phosphate oxidase n=1 Tax=Homoserinimonas sedimenticola TaxID=2986805 RepID=UPI002235EE2E|nr:pyridoxamine 5'-phosphate oxidase [Salinibacterium sedimenticola]MCW4386378.1 pyridoxamine 5'-phosphate oxidase [Salinibacterium sedimenticola]